MRRFLVEIKFKRERVTMYLFAGNKEEAVEWVSNNMPKATSAKAHTLTGREMYIINNINQAHGVGSED